MTNEEKYKTPQERNHAFTVFCTEQNCKECQCYRKGVNCRFAWLALEAEEKLLPCPFCGFSDPYLHKDEERWIVDCGVCGCEIYRSTQEAAIVAWNRRVK